MLDSSQAEGPLVYHQGSGELFAALENQLQGHVAGDVFTVTLSPEEAHGPVHQELLQKVPRYAFTDQGLSIGSRFKAKGADGEEQIITVREIHQNDVIVDANHPLAGKTLVFEIAVVSVTELEP